MPSANIYQRTAIAAAISACFPAMALGAGVARVDFAIGNVTAVAPDGRSRPLAKGSEIDVGDTVNTQAGRAQLRFSDGAYMSLQPQTEFKVDEFKFSGKQADPNDNIVMSLLKGGMRTITGLIGRANRNNYRLRTDVATIGIRGTEYSVKYTNSIEVFCADGSILVQNEGGILQLNGGQGGYVASNDTAPQQTDNRPNLPPESPVNQLLEQGEVADPVNPIQEANPPVLFQPLTGKFDGNIAVTSETFTFFLPPLSGENTAVELNAAGELIAFDTVEGEGPTQIGGAVPESAGNDGIIAWGRWISGVAEGDLVGGVDLATEGVFHYVVGLPVTNMPTTGSATYSMIGHTTPTFSGSITSATLNSSSIAVDFEWSAATVQLGMTVNNSNLNFSTGPMSMNGALFRGSDFLSPSCTSLSVNGFLAGDGATRAGMAYQIDSSILGGRVDGAVAYQRGALGPSGPNPFAQ